MFLWNFGLVLYINLSIIILYLFLMCLSLFFLLIFFSSSLAMAQEKAISVEVAAGPAMADRFIYQDGSFQRGYFGSEGAVLRHGAAFRLLYPLSDKWDVGAGLAYSVKGFKLGPVSYMDIYGRETERKDEFLSLYKFLEIPVFVRYYFIKSSIGDFYGKLGMAPSVYLQSKSTAFDEDGNTYFKSERASYIHPINLDVQAGAGLLFSLGDTWKIGGETELNSFGFPLVKGEVLFRSWLYTLGFNFVVKRSL